MADSFLLRGLHSTDNEWIDTHRGPVSKNHFLLALIREARSMNRTPDLFATSSLTVEIDSGTPFRFIDLFAGIGGFRIGMTLAGGQCVFTNEWDRYAATTYCRWFGDHNFSQADIREAATQSQIPDHDVLCGGFPCQPFSIAGVSKKNSLGRVHGFADPSQGNLFFSILEIIDSKRPPVLFLENVKNLKSHDKGRTWQIILTELSTRDYSVFTRIVDARHWVPQHRERMFIVGFDRRIFGTETQIGFQWPETAGLTAPRLGDILQSEPDKKYMLTDKLWQYLQDYKEKHRAKGNGFGYDVFGPDDVTRTISARYYKDGSEILVRQPGWRNPRRLTPREACLLMGYDDQYAMQFGHTGGFPISVSDTQAYKQFGNSVVPKVVEAIAKAITHCMNQHVLNSGNGCLIKGRLAAASV